MTTARTASRLPASWAAARTSRCSCSSIAFIFGRSRRIVPTPSSTCRVTNSDSATGPPRILGDDVVPGTLVTRSRRPAGGEPALVAGERQRQAEGVRQRRGGEDVVGGPGGHHLAAAQEHRVRVAGRD